MIIIYDFDGTLTKDSIPQYEILKKIGVTKQIIKKETKKQLIKCFNMYKAVYLAYLKILRENNIEINKKNVCLGAEKTEFNEGVKEFFEKYETSKTGVKHYIVTSGIKYFVDETYIKKYIKSIYGVTFTEKNGIYKKIDFLLTDKKKVKVIKKIVKDRIEGEKIIYIGDGLTDKYAFKYIHSIGGINIFVISNDIATSIYNNLKAEVQIDKCFRADFRENAELSKYIENELRKEKDNRGVKCY